MQQLMWQVIRRMTRTERRTQDKDYWETIEKLKRSRAASYKSQYIEEKAKLQPGTRKSAIARAVSERLADDEHLAASIFFQRGITDCDNPYLVFPTIAYQLADACPTLIPHIAAAVEKYLRHGNVQGITHQGQQPMLTLLSEVNYTGLPLVFVVDGIDECLNSSGDAVPEMLRLLCQAATSMPIIRVLITTRPETHIVNALPLDDDPSVVMLDLWKVAPEEISLDIHAYIQSRFDYCARRGTSLPEVVGHRIAIADAVGN